MLKKGALSIGVFLCFLAIGKGNVLVLAAPVGLWTALTFSKRKGEADEKIPRRRRNRKERSKPVVDHSNLRFVVGVTLCVISAGVIWVRSRKSHTPYASEQTVGKQITRAESLYHAGQLREAVTAFEAIIIPPHLTGRKVQKYHNLGVIYVKLKRPENAYAAFLKAVEYDPQDVQAYSLLGRLAFDKGEYGKAVEFYEMALEIAPDKVELQSALAAAKAGANKSSR